MNTMLKACYKGKYLELNELRGRMRHYSIARIPELFRGRGFEWFYLHLPGDIGEFRYLLETASPSMSWNYNEKVWMNTMREFVSFLQNLKGKLDQAIETRKEIDFTSALHSFTNNLEPLVTDYVSTNHSDCPANPHHEPEATWDSWNEKISPKAYLQRVIHRKYVISAGGFQYPAELIK